MNRNEYMAALRRALSVLPEEERASALRYYEEYFDDAGPENEQRVIADLGAPETVAEQILADYRELTAVPHQGAGGTAAKPNHRRRGVPPWLLVVLVLLAIPVGIPLIGGLAIGAVGTVAGLLIAAIAVVLAFVVVLPLTLLVAGVALCGFSIALWGAPRERGHDARLRPCAVRTRRAGDPVNHQAVYPVCAAARPRLCRNHPLVC